MPPAAAMTRGVAALAALGLAAEFTDLASGTEPTAWTCLLRAADGTVAPMGQGTGKGRRADAQVGALFEALEHYLGGPACFDPTTLESVTTEQVLAGPLEAEASAVLLTELSDRHLACHRYQPLLGGGEDLLVPLYLSMPWYVERDANGLRVDVGDDCDYRDLMRYSCNSGAAIGVTAAEALLHALNEVIERDAFSLLLARTFLGDPKSRLNAIDPATLPRHVKEAHAAAERLVDASVHVLDITSDLAVPTMLAYVPPEGARPHRRGVGTSLYPAYAVWRAITEFVQLALASARPASIGGWPCHPDLGGLAAAHPDLHACGRFDLTEHLRTTGISPFTPAARTPRTPAHQLRELVALLATHGHRPYYRTVATLPGDITAVHVIVPGLERFMLVTDGNVVIPGRRAGTPRLSAPRGQPLNGT
jgi:ribosomal protein S12 methylthiotransferase accessory factor